MTDDTMLPMPNIDRKQLIIYSIVLAIVLTGIYRNTFGLKTYSDQKFILHTQTEILVLSRSEQQAQIAIAKAFVRIAEIDAIANFFDPKSELSKINQGAAFKEMPVSSDLYTMLKKSMWGSEVTDGAFDITSTPLTRLYGFGTDTYRIPSKTEVNKAIQLVNYKKVRVNDKKHTVRFMHKGIKLDLGGIAKGYAVDEAVKVLRANGIRSGFVNAGGNIYALGRTKNLTSWKIGIRHPRDPNKIIDIISLKDSAVATSGDYEQYFIKGHRRYHHIMNPKTGTSATGMISDTILAPDAMTCDVLSTGVFVLGPTQGAALLKKLGYKAILIYAKDKELGIEKI